MGNMPRILQNLIVPGTALTWLHPRLRDGRRIVS